MKNIDDFGKKRLCFVATVTGSLKFFMAPHVQALSSSNEIVLMAQGNSSELTALISERVRFVPLMIERDISPLKDFITLCKLIRYFKKNKFDSVHSITPKAGLLTMLAGLLANVPVRIHTFTGQVWLNKSGFSRWLLKFLDKVLVFSATDVLADGFDQADFLVSEGVIKKNEIRVLANGSICGVNPQRFSPNEAVRAMVRNDLRIDEDSVVALYLGRLKRDKGVLDLLAAFEVAAKSSSKLKMLILGPDEDNLEGAIDAVNQKYPGRLIRQSGVTNFPEKFMAASDIFCLPSYREGFNVTLLESAAMGLPSVASKIYGIAEIVIDGETGVLHSAGDVAGLTNGLLDLANDREKRMQMGLLARERVLKRFPQELVVREMLSFYEQKLLAGI